MRGLEEKGGKGRFGARLWQPRHSRGQRASGNLNICHSATWLPPESAIHLMLCGNAHGTCFGRVSEQVQAAVHACFESVSLPFQGLRTYQDLTLSHNPLPALRTALAGL